MTYFRQYILYPYSYDFTSKPPNGGELNDVGAGMKTAITAISGKSYTMGQGTDVLYPAAGITKSQEFVNAVKALQKI